MFLSRRNMSWCNEYYRIIHQYALNNRFYYWIVLKLYLTVRTSHGNVARTWSLPSSKYYVHAIKNCIIWKTIWTRHIFSHFSFFDQFERHVFNYTTIDKVSSVFCPFSLKWQCFCQPLKKVTLKVYLLTIVADDNVFCQTPLRMTVHYVNLHWLKICY